MVPPIRAVFMAMDIRYTSTFITKVAKHKNSVISMELNAPASIPSHRFWQTALTITPVSALVSIILSAAMLRSPPCCETTAQRATYINGVEIRSAENRKDSIISNVMPHFLLSSLSLPRRTCLLYTSRCV